MQVMFLSIADLFINLSAGWFGAAFILPMTVKKFRVNVQLLILDIACGIVSLLIAIFIRSTS